MIPIYWLHGLNFKIIIPIHLIDILIMMASIELSHFSADLISSAFLNIFFSIFLVKKHLCSNNFELGQGLRNRMMELCSK